MKKIICSKEILILALKYSLKRESYAPVLVCDNIRDNIEKFSKKELEYIIEVLKNDSISDKGINKEFWLNFSILLEKYISDINHTKIDTCVGEYEDIEVKRDILIYAFRYALETDLSKIALIQLYIEKNLKMLSSNDKDLFVREAKEYKYCLKASHDTEYYEALLEYLSNPTFNKKERLSL